MYLYRTQPVCRRSTAGFSSVTVIVLLTVVLISGAISAVVLSHHKQVAATTLSQSQTNCLARQFSSGSSGTCVSDIQTMVNFMESDGLTQCPFTGGAVLQATAGYDTATARQVTVVQNWLTCFNKQEGINTPSLVPGVVTPATWSELCTYAYMYPLQNSSSTSSYRAASLTAGKDAGCAAMN
jgi:hypothetical protein